ncbi:unnamed protein product [Amoebophrya sp. A25]|nr:unnamed protein product [Amoebophrya sp. A25]|eukprot:GSA25T00014551001.1
MSSRPTTTTRSTRRTTKPLLLATRPLMQHLAHLLLVLAHLQLVAGYILERTIRRNKHLDVHRQSQVEYLGEFVFDYSTENERIGSASFEAWGELELLSDGLAGGKSLLELQDERETKLVLQRLHEQDVSKGTKTTTSAPTPPPSEEHKKINKKTEDPLHAYLPSRTRALVVVPEGQNVPIIKREQQEQNSPRTQEHEQQQRAPFRINTPSLQILAFDDEESHWFAFQAEIGPQRASGSFARPRCPQVLQTASRVVPLRLDKTSGLHDKATIPLREHIRPRAWHFLAVFCDVKVYSC